MQQNPITIELTKSDTELKEISQLAASIWHEHFTPIIGEEQVAYMLKKFQCYEAMKQQISDQGYEYFRLRFNRQNVGYMAIVCEKNAIFLSKLYISKEYRGKKIAKEAIKQLKESSKQRNIDNIWLTVNRENQNTIAAYLKMGFQIISEQKEDIGNGFYMDDYIMRLKI